MKKIICILLITMLCSSCLYEEITHLNEEDLEWMNPYEQGDTILFTSSTDVDTMVVFSKPLYNSFWPFRENEGNSIYMANSSFKYNIRHDGKSVKGWTTVLKEHDDQLSVYLTLHRRWLDINENLMVQYGRVEIDNIVYADAIKVDDSNSSPNSVEQIANEYFVWSKSKGLLQYKYLNGEVYTYYKKLPRKK